MIRKTVELSTETISFLADDDYEVSNIIVLFLHGFGDEAQRALSLFNTKDRLYSIIAPDMPGCGMSSNNIKEPTMQYYCDIVQEFIKKVIGDKGFYIVAQSLGAVPALYNAIKNANVKQVFGVVPIMPRDESPADIEQKRRWMLASTPEQWYETQLNLFSEYDNDWIITEAAKQKILQTPKSFFEYRIKTFSKLASEIFDMTFVKNLYEKFYKTNRNYMVFLSRNDKFFRFDKAEKYINLYKISTYELNDSGHAMFYKSTPKIHNYINNFIKKTEGFY